MNNRLWGKALTGLVLATALQGVGVEWAQAAAQPTAGTCGIEVNRVLAGGDNAVFQMMALGYTFGSQVAGVSSPSFNLSLLGVLDFSHNTWVMSQLHRQYTANSPTPTDTVTIISGTMAWGTASSANPPGTYPLTMTVTGYVAQGGPGGSALIPPNNLTTNLLVMPVNGGNTLLIQNQTGGNGGGVCQF